LAKVPLGLKVKNAEYPVLRVVASWPGEAELERTLTLKQPMNTKSRMDNIEDPDLHPLATLHLENFNQANERLGIQWFQGDMEQKLVVHAKRAREPQDCESPRP
jgi:hypothetical protein